VRILGTVTKEKKDLLVGCGIQILVYRGDERFVSAPKLGLCQPSLEREGGTLQRDG